MSRALLFSIACTALAPALAQAAEPDPKAPDVYQVRLDTDAGPVVIEVQRALAPLGADRFHRLVKEGFYDDVRIFRVIRGFMAQVGMSGDPKVHAKWGDANIKDDPVKASNTRGMVTFAKTGAPNSRSTQIFINYGDNSRLDADGFAPFGRVIEGMEVVDKFYSGYGERPNQESIRAQGNKYLDAQFPRLTKIKTARVISENGQPVKPAE
jgi:peptidyl-prolyl cis-trans isomerase A (cyclophilin A)